MYYCGVCRSIGRNFGQLPRLGLVNEAAALALILSISSGKAGAPEISRRSCVSHPLKKSMSVINSDETDYAAAVNVMLVYFKLLDSWQDDKNIAARTAAFSLKGAFKKASKSYPIASDSIYFALKRLSALEKRACDSIDEAAEPFSSIMSDIFMWKDSDIFVQNPVLLDLLGKIGYNVGKWIYITDAVSDFDSDKKKGSYNVLAVKYKDRPDMDNVRFILEMCLAGAAKAWEKIKEIQAYGKNTDNINIKNALGAVDNLFYIGMLRKTDTSCRYNKESEESCINKNETNNDESGGMNGSV